MIRSYIEKVKNWSNLNKIFNFVPVFVSVLCLIYVLDSFYSTFSHTVGNRDDLSNSLNFFVKVFQNIIFAFLFLNLFFKFRYKFIGFVAPIAYLEQSENIFANQVHPFLFQNNIYHFFSKNPYAISPEYPRILIFFFILLVSFVLLFTKWKNFKRIFLTLGATGVFFTALLFHSIIIYEIDSFKHRDSNTMKLISTYGKNLNDINKMCLINQYEYYFYDKKNEHLLFEDKEIPDSIKKLLPYFKSDFYKYKNFYWYGIAHNSNSKDRLIGQIPFSISKNENFSLIIKNSVSYKEFLVVNQYVFVLLALASHSVWFFGSIFLIYFHERRFKKRSAV